MEPTNPYQSPQAANPYVGSPGAHLKPGRGAMILVFGLLSWVVCFIFGIMAWTMGKQDLAEIDRGIMDPADRGLTKAGYILGMVSCILAILGLGIVVLVLVFAGGSAALN